MAEAGAGADEVASNRELWTQANSEYAGEHAYRAWAAEDITWGIFNVPEQQLAVLGDVRGLDVVELGCGAAAASSSTRCKNSTPRQMPPIIPTTRWRAPTGHARGRPRKYGPPTSPTDPT
jgi:hypothetical protein